MKINNQLNKIKFKNVEKLYLNNNKIFSIDGLRRLSFKNLKILSVYDNLITKIEKLDNCAFIPSLTELY